MPADLKVEVIAEPHISAQADSSLFLLFSASRLFCKYSFKDSLASTFGISSGLGKAFLIASVNPDSCALDIASPNVRSIKSGNCLAVLPLLITDALNLRFPNGRRFFQQHCLYFFPEPQGQGSFLPTFDMIFLNIIDLSTPYSINYLTRFCKFFGYILGTFMNIPLAKPPWSKLGKRMESSIRKAFYDFDLADKNIAIALSGGKDSLTLLFMLKAISGRGFPDFNLHAVHVSGDFSCGAGVDVPYLKAICHQLNIDLIIKESTQKLETLECYSCSRERRRLLFDAAKSVGATTIAFGHHRDDNAQTILMNMLQKGEFCGNLPKLEMVDYGVTIIRPLAYVSEESIQKFAKQQDFARVMCRCPVGQNSMRKKVNDLISELEVHYPHARKNIAHAGLLYGSEKARRKK